MISIDDLLGKEIETEICEESGKSLVLVTKISIKNPNACYRIKQADGKSFEYENLYHAMEHYKELLRGV